MKGSFGKMTIRFHVDFDDLFAMQQDVIQHSQTHHIKEMYFKWITSIVLFLAALFLMGLSLTAVITSLVIAVIFFLLFPFLYRNIAFFRLKRNMQKNDYSHVLGACEMTISDNGIDRKKQNATTHFDWEQFESWREDSSHYFMYVDDLQGVIISKNPDEMNEQETTAFNEKLRQHAAVLIGEGDEMIASE